MTFSTPVQWPEQAVLHADSRVLLLGSCFADEMTGHFRRCGVPVVSNPFGPLYNPFSIADAVERMLSMRAFDASELIFHDHLFHSFSHHGAFSGTDKETVLRGLNESLERGRKALLEADCLILTLGSAYVYEREGRVVANCHKLPASSFERRLLCVEEIVSRMEALLGREELRGKTIIWTVSPIRHVRDGLSENTLSKATLRLAVERLSHVSGRQYFPSYELMLDELRDYRWYAADMCHPSDSAVEYIWERFTQTCFFAADRPILDEVARVKRMLQHRPLHTDTPEYDAFRQKAEAAWQALQTQYVWLTE